ncbi:hypothetical protein CBR_g41615 [Chara braunii]|uniref:RNA-directed DNA polymerase n=1 Tax=Chara braunii TaxID=69332 RepID=A0A388LWG0_CHABU|nr:hypothetical protein CBR_g41615 [Chara braunii]|eukprot:GBG86552.1 hypothetical protein CBR_g41615 [Chara braunii]
MAGSQFSSPPPCTREQMELQQVERIRLRLEEELRQATKREKEIRDRSVRLEGREADKAALEGLDDSTLSNNEKIMKASILSMHAYMDSKLDTIQDTLDQILNAMHRPGIRPEVLPSLPFSATTGPYAARSGPPPSGTSAAALSQTVASSSFSPATGATLQSPPVSPTVQQFPWYPKTPLKPPPTFSGDKKDEALDTWLRTVPVWVRAKRILVEEEVITAASYLEGSAARWLNGLVASNGFGRNMGGCRVRCKESAEGSNLAAAVKTKAAGRSKGSQQRSQGQASNPNKIAAWVRARLVQEVWRDRWSRGACINCGEYGHTQFKCKNLKVSQKIPPKGGFSSSQSGAEFQLGKHLGSVEDVAASTLVEAGDVPSPFQEMAKAIDSLVTPQMHPDPTILCTLDVSEALEDLQGEWSAREPRESWVALSRGPRGEHFVVEVGVGGRKCGAFVDIGSTRNFISRDCVDRLCLKDRVQRLSTSVASTLANKEHMMVEDCVKDAVCTFSYPGGEINHKISFLVSNKFPFDMLLGMYYLEVANPQFDWDKKVLKHELPSERTVRLAKYKASRLIDSYGCLCASAFYNYYKQNQEEGMYLVYVSAKGEAVKTPLEIETIVAKYPDLFEEPSRVVDREVVHAIQIIPGSKTPKGRIYRMAPAELDELRRQLKELTKKGWIRPSTSPFGSSVQLVPKKGGTLRMCIDYRGLNAITVKNAEPLPRIDDLLDRVQGSFKHLKHALTHHEVLMVPDPQRPFVVTTDASQYDIGAVLAQQEGKKLRPVKYMSKKMPSKKLAKSTYERELYALYKALVHGRHYLLGRFFYLRTNHQTLKWIKTQPVLSDALKRWIEVIDQYDFKVDYVKGEYNKVADALSRRADYLGALIYEFGLSEDQTVKHIKKSQEVMIASENKRRTQCTFQVGERVWVKATARAASNLTAREQAAAARAAAMANGAASAASSSGTQLGMPLGSPSTSGSEGSGQSTRQMAGSQLSPLTPRGRELLELQQVERIRERLERELKQATDKEREIKNRTARLDTLEADKAALEGLDESAMSDQVKILKNSMLLLHAHVDSRLDFMQNFLDQILDLLQRPGFRPAAQSPLPLTARSGPFQVQAGTQPSGTSAAAAQTVASSSSGSAVVATPSPQQPVPQQGQQQGQWYPKTPMKPPLAFSGEKKDEELNTWLRTVPVWVRAKRTLQEEEVITAASYLEGVVEREIVHAIEIIPGSKTPKGRIYRMAPVELDELQRQLKELTEKGWIRPSTSPYGSPVLFVPKKGGTLRMCIDYRGLNAITVKNAEPLPRIDDLLDRVQGCKYYSKIDLKSDYHQTAIRPEDQHKTAFQTRYGLYEFVVMPFGLCNAPGTFQYAMNRIFHDHLDKFVVVYLDDILIFSKSVEEHAHPVETVLSLLRQHKYKVNLEKCEFGRTKILYLGHEVSVEGIRPEDAKVASIRDWPRPQTVTEVRSFLGMCDYYRNFVKNYSKIASPLTDLTQLDMPWDKSDECEAVFKRLKHALMNHEVLMVPDPQKPFIVTTDASQYDIGAVLAQQHEKNLRPIEYMSKKMPSKKLAKSTYERELYALYKALVHWRHFLLGRFFYFRTDHQSLKWIKTQPALSYALKR